MMNVKLTKYFRNTPMHKLTRQEHNFLVAAGVLNEFYPKACGVYEDDVKQSGLVTQEHFDAFVGDFIKGDKDE